MSTSTTGDTNKKRTVYNCHTHLFTLDHIPDKFFGFLPVQALRNKVVRPFGSLLLLLARLLNGKEAAKKYAAFLAIADRKNQGDTFKYLRGFYPKDSKFVVLTMDFEYMERGKPAHSFTRQLDELAALKKDYPEELYPFICADPRREGLLDLVKDHIEHKGFAGIKLYPSLGYFPTDPRLDALFAYAAAHQVPVLTHCIPINAVYYKGEITKEMISTASRNLNIPESEIDKRNEQFAQYLNHPLNFVPVLTKYPDLKLCIGHFGGNEEWDRYLDESWNDMAQASPQAKSWFSVIRDLITGNRNVYSDISFTVHDSRLYPLLKVQLKDPAIRKKVLFGTDFFMLEKDYTERRFSIDVRGYLDEEDYWQIAETNPAEFLHRKVMAPVEGITMRTGVEVPG